MTCLLRREFTTFYLPYKNTGNLEQFCCRNQRETQQSKLFLGKTIVVNYINSVRVIRNSGLSGAKRLGKGFGPRGKMREDKLGERIIRWKHAREIRSWNSVVKQQKVVDLIIFHIRPLCSCSPTICHYSIAVNCDRSLGKVLGSEIQCWLYIDSQIGHRNFVPSPASAKQLCLVGCSIGEESAKMSS
jgi:hypothetical protein